MKEIIQVFNELKVDNFIVDYAIGGGVATIFYTEPIDTLDVDIFILFEQSSSLISLTNIYERLASKNYKPEGEYIKIGSNYVQILAALTLLEEEAIREANSTLFEGLPCKIFKAEHLIAICLKVGIYRDYYKASLLMEQAVIDKNLLQSIISKYNLEDQWNKLLSK